MTTLFGLNAYQSEALVACLAASVVWAGVLLFGAMHLERRGTARGDKLWIAALLLAILPSLAAPSLAAFGVSLRAPSADPVIVEGARSGVARDITVADIAAASPSEAALETASLAGASPLMTFDQATDALALLYVYGAGLALFIWIARQAGFLLAAGLAKPVRNEKLLSAAGDWAFDFGVKAPALKLSRHVSSVCVYGAVSPVILIPEDLGARVAEDDIALMCAHEIAHLKRGDTRLFTATALARVLFWFNPLVTRIAAQVELAAEEGADRLVIAAGVDRRAYASCFVNGLKYAAMKQSLLPALSPGFTPADRQGRRRRFDSILSTDNERRASVSTRVALAGAASVAALLAVGQAAFAVDPEAAAEKKRLAAQASADGSGETGRKADPLMKKPVDGDVTLPFGKTYTSLEDNKTLVEHQGLDIKAVRGEPVRASADGVVVEATTRLAGKESYGTTVVIDHGHGLLTRYAHLDSYKVAIGDKVKKGEVIGAVGATGKVTGPHLHFEVLKNGKPVAPSFATAPEAPTPPEAPMWADAAPPVEPIEPLEPFAPEEFDAFVMVDGDDPAVVAIAGPDGFAFADGDTLTDRMAEDFEHRLLGDIEIADGAAYDIEFTLDGETHRFTSSEPLTPEKRSELKAVIEKMRAHRDEARKHAAVAQKEWRKQAEKMRAEAQKQAEAMRRTLAKPFVKEEVFSFRWVEDTAAARRDADEAQWEAEEAEREAAEAVQEAERDAAFAALEAERDALEAESDALSDARADLHDAITDGLEDALAEIDDEAAALVNEDMSEDDRRIARQALAEARRGIELARRDHEREIERARRDLERRDAEIQRQLDRIDDRMREGN